MFSLAEAGGDNFTCGSGRFDCGPNILHFRCISNSWICDGDRDCANGADEATCGMHSDSIISHNHHYAQ